jgi:hypothetical protein
MMPATFNQLRTKREVSSTSAHDDSHSSFLPGFARGGEEAEMRRHDVRTISPIDIGKS